MTWVAVIFTPIVLLYQAWTYWVFRKRIAVHHIPTAGRGRRRRAAEDATARPRRSSPTCCPARGRWPSWSAPAWRVGC